jgi:hypothetical protein
MYLICTIESFCSSSSSSSSELRINHTPVNIPLCTPSITRSDTDTNIVSAFYYKRFCFYIKVMLVAYLEQKIQNMTEQHTSALCIAADRIVRTERALDRMYMQESEAKNHASDLEHDSIDSP